MGANLSDIPLTSDFMSKSKLKPWFETIGTVITALMLLVSIVIFSLLRPLGALSFHCTLEKGPTKELAAADIAAVNTDCYNSWDSPLKYADVISTIFFTLIYFSRASWNLVPCVKKAFHDVKGLDEALSSEEESELVKLITSPFHENATEEKKEFIRKARSTLLKGNTKEWSIAAVYTFRNALTAVLSLVSSMVLQTAVLSQTDLEVSTYHCKSDIFEVSDYEMFKCQYKKPLHIVYLLHAFNLFSLLQTLIALVCVLVFAPTPISPVSTLVDIGDESCTSAFKLSMRNNRFLHFFAKRSQHLNDPTMALLSKNHLKWIFEVKKNARESWPRDSEFKELYKNMIGESLPEYQSVTKIAAGATVAHHAAIVIGDQGPIYTQHH